MAIHWIKHSNKKILYVDYTNFEAKEILPQMRTAADICLSESNKVLFLANFTGIDLGTTLERTEILRECYSLGNNIFNSETDKSAVIGMSGVKKLFFNLYLRFSNHKIELFETKEEALEYLAVSETVNRVPYKEDDLVF